jgi:hypothetical protein
MQLRAGEREPLDEDGDGVEHVLGVVEREQDGTRPEGRDERLDGSQAAGGRGVTRPRHRVVDPAGLGQRSQVDPADAVELRRQRAHRRRRQPGLADTARPDDSHHTPVPDGGLQRGELLGAPDERGERCGRARPQQPRPGVVRVHDGVPDQRPVARQVELAAQGRDVALHGADGNEEPASDLLVRQLPAQQGQHLPLPG